MTNEEDHMTGLAALPAPDLADGLILKLLEWKKTDDAIGEEAFVASTPVGEYLATEAGLYFHVSDATSGDLLLATNGASEAKTAAFADYSRRILSAIDTSVLSAKLVVVDASRNELAKDGGKRAKDALAALASPALAAETQAVPEGMAARDVLAERRRQIEGEGWTPEHDDAHANGELAGAAACYCLGSVSHWARSMAIQSLWPWDKSWWKPTDRRRNLVKAGALIFAEIDRLDRLAASPAVQGGE